MTGFADEIHSTKLASGEIISYTNNYSIALPAEQQGYFFVNIDQELNATRGQIIRTEYINCTINPYISKSGKIIIGTAATDKDSFSVSAIQDNHILYERFYPKFNHPQGRFRSSGFSAIELNEPGKIFVSFLNELSPFTSYTELFNDNLSIKNEKCGPHPISKSSVSPVEVFSNKVIWDTAFSLRPTSLDVSIETDDVSLIYSNNCQLISSCDSVKINGPENVCIDSEFQIVLRKKENCLKQIELFQKGNNFKFLNMIGDSIYVIKATGQSEIAGLYARFKDCPSNILDSVSIRLVPDTMNSFKLPFQDSTICYGDSLVIFAPSGYNSYSWNSSEHDTGRALMINAPGTYNVKAVNYCGRIFSDSVIIKSDNSKIQIEPDHFAICLGDTAIFRLVTNSQFSDFSWEPTLDAKYNPQKNEIFAWPKQYTTYSFKAKSSNNCLMKSLAIVEVHPKPIIDDLVNGRYEICKDDSISISIKPLYPKYFWNNGVTGPQITLYAPGNYSLSVMDTNNCLATINFDVFEKHCKKDLYFPTAFTPNNDGLNDEFRIISNGFKPIHFELKIFNRWGENVFTTNNIEEGWDGTVKGKMQPVGSYIWTCRYKFSSNSEVLEKGKLTLKR